MGPVRWVTGAVGELLVTAGCLLLLFVAWQLWWTDVESNRDQRGAIQSLEREFEQAPPVAEEERERPDEIPTGDAFAILRIPRLGDDWVKPIYQGTDHDTLTRGLGHYAETALNGKVGNFAVAGHRTTYGRPFHDIEKLVKGDKVVVETKSGYDVYVVDSHEIVRPTRTEVIAPVPDAPGETPTEAWLTMTACHPKYSAEFRYIVHAKLQKSFTREQGLPAGTLGVPQASGSVSGPVALTLPGQRPSAYAGGGA